VESGVDRCLEIVRQEEIGLRGEDLRISRQPDGIGTIETHDGLGNGRRLGRGGRLAGPLGLASEIGRTGVERAGDNAADALGLVAAAVAVDVDAEFEEIERNHIVALLTRCLQQSAGCIHLGYQRVEHAADPCIVERLRIGICRHRQQ
jgi:hypothetical protein